MLIINFFASLIFSWFILFLVQPLMRRYGLNKPKYNDEKRDLDINLINKTLRGGGLSFIISTLIIVLLNKSNIEIASFSRILISCIPLASLGLIDDYYHIPKLIRFFFRYEILDFTFAYRLYPRQALEKYKIKELRHGFALEILLNPIKKGFKVITLPAKWKKRVEGSSSITIKSYLSYLKVLFRNL